MLSITVAEPYGRDWEQIHMRHLAPVMYNSLSQSTRINQTITYLNSRERPESLVFFGNICLAVDLTFNQSPPLIDNIKNRIDIFYNSEPYDRSSLFTNTNKAFKKIYEYEQGESLFVPTPTGTHFIIMRLQSVDRRHEKSLAHVPRPTSQSKALRLIWV